jgi:uncharacterized YigZ family protein
VYLPGVTADDTYTTISAPSTAETKEKASRFIAEAFPVSSPEEAEAHIQAVRKREYNATHVCSAWRVGPTGASFRFNDDGEPSGSAGMPILRHIEGRSLTDVLVTVTRYYGGTKLGTGGLIRAYGDAAALALDAAPVKHVVLRDKMTISFAYDDTSPAMHVLGQFDAVVGDATYDDRTHLTVAVRKSETERFCDVIVDALGGRVDVVRLPDADT